LWNNGDDLYNCSATFSCIEDIDSGTGNIHMDPMFFDADSNDFHLWYSSPCIDAGDPNSDFSNEPDGGLGRINMGAYGNMEEAATRTDFDDDGISDEWELYYWPGDDPNQHNPNDDLDNDGLPNIDEYNLRFNPTVPDVLGDIMNTRDYSFYGTLVEAIAHYQSGDTLLIFGQHEENLTGTITVSDTLMIRAWNPEVSPVIRGKDVDTHVFTVNSGSNLTLIGLTIYGGKNGVNSTNSILSISNCIIKYSYKLYFLWQSY
jgi:hypothetical protein